MQKIMAGLFRASIFIGSTLPFFTHSCYAGLPAGPYLVWANLHQANRPQITESITLFSKTQKAGSFCGEYASGRILYIKKRPLAMSNNQIALALDQRDSNAIRLLTRNLLDFRDPPIEQGLDGIIAYSEYKHPHMISINSRGKIKSSGRIRNINDSQQISEAFCSVMPEVFRQ